MKLKAIHTYQYVRFQNNNENFLCADRKNMLDLTLELLPNSLVSVKSSKDHILVSLTNIAYLIPLTPETAKKEVVNRGQIGDIVPGSPKK